MRRHTVGLGLTALGSLLVSGALAVNPLLAPALVTLPLDQAADPTAAGTDVSWYDLGNMEQLTGLSATAAQTVRGDESSAEASSSTAVWSSGTVITSDDGDLLNASSYTVCLDRHQAFAVECDVDAVDDEETQVVGLTMTFPFHTERKSYQVFNSTTGQAFDAEYEGEETLDGLTVYRFQQDIPETVIRSLDGPAELAGADGDGTVEADVVYSNERTLWVEPTSGVIVTAEEHPYTVLRGPDGTEGAVLLAGDFTGTDDTRDGQVALAEDTSSKITLLETILPWTLGVLGVLLIIAGALLSFTDRRPRTRRGGHARRDEELQPVG